MKIRISEQELFSEASGNFLTGHIPVDFNYSTEAMEEFIEEHRWHHIEYTPWDEVEEMIYDCAKGMQRLLESKGVEVYNAANEPKGASS